MQAYSMDLRERALLDSDAGMKAADVAVKYRVSGSWVRLLKQRRRETGCRDEGRGRCGEVPRGVVGGRRPRAVRPVADQYVSRSAAGDCPTIADIRASNSGILARQPELGGNPAAL